MKKDSRSPNMDNIIINAPLSKLFLVKKEIMLGRKPVQTYFGFKIDEATKHGIRPMTGEELKGLTGLVRTATKDASENGSGKSDYFVLATKGTYQERSVSTGDLRRETSGSPFQDNLQMSVMPPLNALNIKKAELSKEFKIRFRKTVEKINDIYIVRGNTMMGDRTTWNDPTLPAFMLFRESNEGFEPFKSGEIDMQSIEYGRLRNHFAEVSRSLNPNGFAVIFANRKIPYDSGGSPIYATRRPLSESDRKIIDSAKRNLKSAFSR